MCRYREHEVRPGSFKVKFERAAGVGQENVAAPQTSLLAAVDDPGFAREVHAGDVEVTLRPRDLPAPMHRAKSLA
jgi:hypothetical protein